MLQPRGGGEWYRRRGRRGRARDGSLSQIEKRINEALLGRSRDRPGEECNQCIYNAMEDKEGEVTVLLSDLGWVGSKGAATRSSLSARWRAWSESKQGWAGLGFGLVG